MEGYYDQCLINEHWYHCADCSEYPCDNMKECFEVTRSFMPKCEGINKFDIKCKYS